MMINEEDNEEDNNTDYSESQNSETEPVMKNIQMKKLNLI